VQARSHCRRCPSWLVPFESQPLGIEWAAIAKELVLAIASSETQASRCDQSYETDDRREHQIKARRELAAGHVDQPHIYERRKAAEDRYAE
jgi:hypothetical protein